MYRISKHRLACCICYTNSESISFCACTSTHTHSVTLKVALYHSWEIKPFSCTSQSCFSPPADFPCTPPSPVHHASSCLPSLPLLLCCSSSWDRACHRNVTGRRWWVSGLTDEAALLFPSLRLHSYTQTPVVQGNTVYALILQPHIAQAGTTLATHSCSSMTVSLSIL